MKIYDAKEREYEHESIVCPKLKDVLAKCDGTEQERGFSPCGDCPIDWTLCRKKCEDC